MEQHYYLYLDESGDFAHDDEKKRRKNWSPSLIGGILLKNTFSNIKKKNLFSEKESHCKNETAEEVFAKFIALDELNPKYVIFSNEECIKVINNNLTYQNIMAEGIIQLLTKLKAEEESGEVFLDIHIARRIIIRDDERWDSNKQYDVVPLEAYEERIRERLIMAGNRANIRPEEWSLSLGSALKDDMLKMADVVCNTYLTRNTKFKDEKYEKIRQVYSEDSGRIYIFSVFESSISHIFQSAIADGRMGEAVTIICQCEENTFIEKYLNNVKARLQAASVEEWKVQYKYIVALVDRFINVERDYRKCEKLLNNLLEYFIPILNEIGSYKTIAAEFELDLLFYLLTVCTHNGNVEKSIACEKKCDELINKMPFSLQMVDYQIQYSNRKIINQINQFEFESAREECEKLVTRCENVKEILDLMSDQAEQKIFYKELGKAYSNLVQIYTFLLRKNHSLYESAVEISNCAISEMQQETRQYQYRAVLETEAGYFDKAFLALLVAGGCLQPEEIDLGAGMFAQINEEKEIKQLCKNLAKKLSVTKDEYLVANYIRLMAEGKRGEWALSDVMFECYTNSDICKELSGEVRKYQHPYEIIYWKLASYYSETDKRKAANDNYSKAIQICHKINNSITLKYIGFAVELEQYAYALKNSDNSSKKIKSSLQAHYENMRSDKAFDNMKDLFGDFSNNLSEKWMVYYDMSRRVSY